MSQELELLTRVENDRKWLDSQIESIREKHVNEFVAVKNSEIIASAKNLSELIRKLKGMKEDPSLLLIKFIPEKGVTLIL
jgi:hypothetical protein